MRTGSEMRRGAGEPAGRRDLSGTAAMRDEVDIAPVARLRLTDGEKAMLFDLAMEAGGFRGAAAATRSDALAAAPLILAFAQAYVSIRDRAEGIV